MAERFTTSDGVELGYERTGSGPPLVLVHGSFTDRSCFEAIVPPLSEHFEVLAYNRRGRGDSGDSGAPYEVQREMLDLAEIASFAGGGEAVDVFGYSFGGMLSLSLAATDEAVETFRRLAVYEPPFNHPELFAGGVGDEVRAMLAAGDRAGAMRRFVGGTFRLPAPVLDAMEAHPAWATSLDTLHTFDRETAAVESLAVPEKVNPDVPVLHIVAAEGGNPAFPAIAEQVAAANAGVRVERIGGIPHFAIPTEPRRMVELLVEHFAPDA